MFKNLYRIIIGNRESGKTYSMVKGKSKKELVSIVLKQNQEITVLKCDNKMLRERIKSYEQNKNKKGL